MEVYSCSHIYINKNGSELSNSGITKLLMKLLIKKIAQAILDLLYENNRVNARAPHDSVSLGLGRCRALCCAGRARLGQRLPTEGCCRSLSLTWVRFTPLLDWFSHSCERSTPTSHTHISSHKKQPAHKHKQDSADHNWQNSILKGQNCRLKTKQGQHPAALATW